MPEPVLIPIIYRCGHTVNILSPGVSDPEGRLGKQYGGNSSLIAVLAPEGWDDKCWNCGDRFKTVVPPEVTETLRKAKLGEKIL